MRRMFLRWKTALQAGLIVAKCRRENWLMACRTDDETETIQACYRHAKEIDRLGEINRANWKKKYVDQATQNRA